MARNTTSEAPAGASSESQNENVQPSGESTPAAATTTPDAPSAPATAEPPAPTAPAAPAPKGGDCKVKNESCKGLTISGVTGDPIVFDNEGVAVCRSVELDHFLKIPGYSEVK